MGGSNTEAQDQRSQKRKASSSKGTSPVIHTVPTSDAPTSFSIRSGTELDQLVTSTALPQDSMYGIRSVNSTASDGSTKLRRDGPSIDTMQLTESSDSNPPMSAQASGRDSAVQRIPPPVMNLTTSGLLTPQHLYSPNLDTDSAPISSPKSVSLRSLRLSDDEYAGEDSASQAVTSGGEEEDEDTHNGNGDMSRHDEIDGSLSQLELVMPSIRMPSRRPFTERGRRVGKLKIMVSGSAGTFFPDQNQMHTDLIRHRQECFN